MVIIFENEMTSGFCHVTIFAFDCTVRLLVGALKHQQMLPKPVTFHSISSHFKSTELLKCQKINARASQYLRLTIVSLVSAVFEIFVFEEELSSTTSSYEATGVAILKMLSKSPLPPE